MSPSTLVVCYSRTGTTRRAAQAVADALDAPLAELRDTQRRDGLLGYLRCGFEGTFGRLTALANPFDNARDFDLVVIGTPVWNASVSSPVRAFLRHHRGRLRRVAFFLTEGGRGAERVFQQMETEVGRAPVACLALRESEVHNESCADRFEHFARGLRPALEVRIPPPLPKPAIRVRA